MTTLGMQAELGKKLGLGVWQEDDLQTAFLALLESGTGDLHRVAAGEDVLHGKGTAAADLKSIVEIRTRGQSAGAKAGAGVVDLKKLNGRSGTIFNGGVDMRRVTAGQGEKRGQQCCNWNGPEN